MALGLPAGLFNVLLGALITIASTLVAWAGLHWNQRRVDRDRTRRAVVHEVNHIADNVAELIDLESGAVLEPEVDRIVVTLSPDTLDDDLRQVNKLTSPEVRRIYEFYELTRVLRRKLDGRSGDEVGGEDVRAVANEIVEKRDEIDRIIKRSRLSLFTEWYKERDRRLRNR
ncbi:hypothetical protein [Halobellus ruber]|uniref:Uncharacterized protein n=1 Tax=Halobellus ruber TaxID=2761102 RepID=A0A7J9SLA2_9EURY|nr:hypothetical protein [Halobellus ruber]MBB6647730.1 hypothetical protein [Halobellus ruber]